MGSLPLMDQPGGQWRYNTSSQVLGVLVARASGQPAEAFYAERIFGPLGMHDTGFRVPAAELHRLVPCYQAAGGGLGPFHDHRPWSCSPVLTARGARPDSSVGDSLSFGRIRLDGRAHPRARLP